VITLNSAASARREALSCRNAQRKHNREVGQGAMHEYAYSPATFAVGIRPHDWRIWPDANRRERFNVHNIYYPRYRDDDGVNDWVSVGTDAP
jgi:hypothetical protein